MMQFFGIPGIAKKKKQTEQKVEEAQAQKKAE